MKPYIYIIYTYVHVVYQILFVTIIMLKSLHILFTKFYQIYRAAIMGLDTSCKENIQTSGVTN